MARKKLILEYNQALLDKLTAFYKSRQGGAGAYVDDEVIQDSYLKKMERLIALVRRAKQTVADPSATENKKQEASGILTRVPEKLLEKDRFNDINQWIKKELLPDGDTPWTVLERFVDSFEPSRGEQRKAKKELAKDIDIQVTNAEEVYNQNGLEIFEGSTQKSCIKYGTRDGKVQFYTWCIGAVGARTMYHSYRFGGSKMFYYVFDKKRVDTFVDKGYRKEFDDKYHAIVIHVYQDGKFGLTLADNQGDKMYDTWESLCADLPEDLAAKLLPLGPKGKDIFKFVPPTAEEIELEAIGGKPLSFEDFSKLRYEIQAAYVGARAQELPSDFFRRLPLNLKKIAINDGRVCRFNELEDSPELLKWYPEYRFTRKPDEPLPVAFLPYLRKVELQEKYFEKFGKDMLGFYEVEKYFPAIVEDYVKKEVAGMNPLPIEAKAYMDDKTEQLYNFYAPIYRNLEYPKVNLAADESLTKARPLVTPPGGFVSYDVYSEMSPEERRDYTEAAVKIAKSDKTKNFEILLTYAPIVIQSGSEIIFATEDENFNIQIFTASGKLIAKDALELEIDGQVVLPVESLETYKKYFNVNSLDEVTYVNSKNRPTPLTLQETNLNMKSPKLQEIIRKMVQEVLAENAPVKTPVKPGTTEKPKNPNAPKHPSTLPKTRPKAKKEVQEGEENPEELAQKIVSKYNQLKKK